MNLPHGARAIPDPEAEVERLAAARKPAEPPAILAEGVMQIPDPCAPGESFWVQVAVAAEKPHAVRSDILERIGDAIAASVTTGP